MSDESSLSAWHKKQDIPDPERRIGTTPDGKPIFIDLRELLTSPEEHQERWDATLDKRQKAVVEKMASDVLQNAAIFIEDTFLAVSNRSGKERYMDGNAQAAFSSANEQGFTAVQDGLKTIIKVRGKIIRDMTASVDLRFREHVIRKVNELVRNLSEAA